MILPSLAALALAGAPAAEAVSSGGVGSGGAGIGAPSPPPAPPAPVTPAPVSSAPVAPLPAAHPTVAGDTAQIINGLAYAPAAAPIQVQRAIWAGDRIRSKPYVYGGGHAKWNDIGYDCSGSVSYVLHAAGLLKTSKDSSDFMSWGLTGAGQWITVYTNPGHALIEIAGIRLDTSAEQDPQPGRGSGPRWRPLMASTASYMARHPMGF